jgi:hypothetical protein
VECDQVVQDIMSKTPKNYWPSFISEAQNEWSSAFFPRRIGLLAGREKTLLLHLLFLLNIASNSWCLVDRAS